MNKLPLIERGDHSNQFKSRAHYDVRITTQILLVFVAIVFLVLFSSLFELTIAKGDYYRRLSDENRIREIIIEPKRGTIIDTKGQALATVEPKQQKTKDRIELRRVYREPESIAPLVGYRQIADENDLKNDLCFDKSILGDKVGKKGIEKLYECDLRGKKGKKLIELDARGKQYKVLTVIPPEDGKTIQLGLDLRLQKKAQELLKDKKGAVIGLIPKTGEVITLFSSPSYNIQDFEDAKNQVIQSYLTSDAHPLFNRATEGVYPPGSIYKLFVATGALEEKKIDTSTIFEDTGTIQAGPITFGNWYFLEYGR
ncbi:MAG: penicillin-binding transpeptidase domain-containing protein, partial [Patescibacteria group bacterium]